LLLGSRIALLAAGRLVGVYRPEEFLRASEPEARAFVDSLDAGAPRGAASGAEPGGQP
jgi:hypothetical protein